VSLVEKNKGPGYKTSKYGNRFLEGVRLSARASRLSHKCHENVTICVLKLVVADCCLLYYQSMSPLGSVSLTSDCCLFQHQITSNFYATVSYKLNASINKPKKARLPSLNPKQSEISPLNGEVA